jgi:hypothetical protein
VTSLQRGSAKEQKPAGQKPAEVKKSWSNHDFGLDLTTNLKKPFLLKERTFKGKHSIQS